MSTAISSPLSGLTVLAVEDESLVAMLLEDLLTDLGCSVAGPAATSADALRLLEERRVDAAVLDINIVGGNAFAIADRLQELHIPFIFATGYGAAGVHEPHRERTVLQKPYSFDKLQRALEGALDARA